MFTSFLVINAISTAKFFCGMPGPLPGTHPKAKQCSVSRLQGGLVAQVGPGGLVVRLFGRAMDASEIVAKLRPYFFFLQYACHKGSVNTDGTLHLSIVGELGKELTQSD
jgi:hypothetical protein